VSSSVIQGAYDTITPFACRSDRTDEAEAALRATDLAGDGVSDLDGRIDALYLGREVLEWANHAERVRRRRRWVRCVPGGCCILVLIWLA
jgi:hypothetical protein